MEQQPTSVQQVKQISPPNEEVHTVFLALGSNIGERENNLRAALQRLREVVALHTISPVYETEPVGFLAQPSFLNIVCSGTTHHSAIHLLQAAKEIERVLGRRPSFRNAPRPVDIDILFYDALQMESAALTIPHPRLRERAFVLVPLADIAPHLLDPVSGKSVQELTDAVSHSGVRRTDITLIPGSPPGIH